MSRLHLLTTTAHPTMYQHADPDTGADVHENLGRLITPRHTSSIELTAEAGLTWAADNDCFQGLDERRYVDMLDRITGLAGCKFVTVPDVVGDAAATRELFDVWAPELEARGLPVGYVLQDGSAEAGVPWDRIDALFIGGSTEYKLGPEAAEFACEAKRLGKWVHWGRVNTLKRINYIASLGAADSVDGSKWARWRKTYLDTGLRWVREAEALTPEPAPTAAPAIAAELTTRERVAAEQRLNELIHVAAKAGIADARLRAAIAAARESANAAWRLEREAHAAIGNELTIAA